MSGDNCISGGKFEFPECWNNDIRMGALFAPFRSKSVNPTDWNSKMKFWTNLIENWCKYNKCPVIEISNLKNSFSRKEAVPACLEDVLLHLNSTGILINKDTFMQPDENWKNWAIKILVINPLKWTFNTVKSTIINGNEQKETYYVHLPVVKQLSEELEKNMCKNSQGKIVKFEDLIKWGFETSDNLSVVLHWMQKQGLIGISHENDVTLVKLSRNGVKPVVITETDLGIYSLERQLKLLEDNIVKLEIERDTALEETKKHLAAKMKNLAKLSLRRKIEIEKTIEKRVVTLENIRGILNKIEQAKLDSDVFDSYKKGIATLKQIYKETGLNTEVVTDTMYELEEVLNSRNDIEEALAKPLEPDLEKELEEELNEILLKNAPEIPTELPSNTKNKNKKIKQDNITAQLQALSI